MNFKVKKLWVGRWDKDGPECLTSRKPDLAVSKRLATPKDETLQRMADMLDDASESCNAHDFTGLHRRLGIILRQEVGRPGATRIMRRLVNYDGLHGLNGVVGEGNESLVKREVDDYE